MEQIPIIIDIALMLLDANELSFIFKQTLIARGSEHEELCDAFRDVAENLSTDQNPKKRELAELLSGLLQKYC